MRGVVCNSDHYFIKVKMKVKLKKNNTSKKVANRSKSEVAITLWV